MLIEKLQISLDNLAKATLAAREVVAKLCPDTRGPTELIEIVSSHLATIEPREKNVRTWVGNAINTIICGNAWLLHALNIVKESVDLTWQRTDFSPPSWQMQLQVEQLLKELSEVHT